MKLLRTTLTAIFCCLLLSFNTLAAALLAVDQCMHDTRSGMQQMADMPEMADTLAHLDCAGADQGWVSSTAQLLCDQSGDCQMGGAVVPGATALTAAPPESAAPVFTLLGFNPTYPPTFWRPPRY